MKRRQFLEKLGIGSASVVAAAPVLTGTLAAPKSPDEKGNAGKSDDHDHDHRHGHDHWSMEGVEASATVSFGAWPTDFTPPLDRYPNVQPPPPANEHQLIPYVSTIQQGGSVNFIISGLHQVIVYGPGKKPEDVRTPTSANPAPTRPTTGTPAGVPLINDPDKRLYAGPDPSIFLMTPVAPAPVSPLRDRIEVIHFPNPGLYLVICGVLPHFEEGMYGWVRVRRTRKGN